MLAARRDPILDHGAPDAPLSPPTGHAGGHSVSPPTRFARFIAGLQIVGTVLGIPIGLASGYSIYRANFSPEASCGGLRANIISMLDKSADAATLRLLVRRDVTTFEHSCGAVDPDAVAAFRTLLAKPAVVAKDTKPEKQVQDSPRVASAQRALHARQTESEKRVTAKSTPVAIDAKPVRSNADADWLAAVRRALVEHAPVARAQAAEIPVSLAPAAAIRPVAAPMGKPLPVQVQAAPPLPPATAVSDVPAHRTDHDHPVPPALIPNPGPPPAR